MSECLGTSVMSRYGRIRSGNNLPDQHFRQSEISVTGSQLSRKSGGMDKLEMSLLAPKDIGETGSDHNGKTCGGVLMLCNKLNS